MIGLWRVTDQSTEPAALQEPLVTDQNPNADVLHELRNRTEAQKQRDWDAHNYTGRPCKHCGGPILRFPVSVSRNRRRDTKYCSGKCRTAACRKREKVGIKKRTDGKLQHKE